MQGGSARETGDGSRPGRFERRAIRLAFADMQRGSDVPRAADQPPLIAGERQRGPAVQSAHPHRSWAAVTVEEGHDEQGRPRYPGEPRCGFGRRFAHRRGVRSALD